MKPKRKRKTMQERATVLSNEARERSTLAAYALIEANYQNQFRLQRNYLAETAAMRDWLALKKRK